MDRRGGGRGPGGGGPLSRGRLDRQPLRSRAAARTFAINVSGTFLLGLLVVCVGSGETVAQAAAALDTALQRPMMTLERVQVLRRDGLRLGELEAAPPVLEHDPVWAQKLTVHSSEDDRVDGHALHRALVQRLRRERLAGATTLRAVWGFRGDERPHGDRLSQTRRDSSVMTIAVDTHERIAEVFGVVEEVTAASGLVTVETVPTRILPG